MILHSRVAPMIETSASMVYPPALVATLVQARRGVVLGAHDDGVQLVSLPFSSDHGPQSVSRWLALSQLTQLQLFRCDVNPSWNSTPAFAAGAAASAASRTTLRNMVCTASPLG